jgi:hypothetical protein
MDSISGATGQGKGQGSAQGGLSPHTDSYRHYEAPHSPLLKEEAKPNRLADSIRIVSDCTRLMCPPPTIHCQMEQPPARWAFRAAATPVQRSTHETPVFRCRNVTLQVPLSKALSRNIPIRPCSPRSSIEAFWLALPKSAAPLSPRCRAI